MKTGIKKSITILIFALLTVNIFAAPMNLEKGYKDLSWGTTVKQAQNKGYKLSILSTDQATVIQQYFTEKVDVYYVKSTEKQLTNLFFVYSKDKLIFVYEILENSNISLKTLQSRYGEKVFATGINQGEFVLKDSKGNLNAMITLNNSTTAFAMLFDYNSFSKISVAINGSSNTIGSSSDFVVQFDGLAQKLLQEPKKSSKATYAFLDFTTDNKNSAVEKYITDALTEAVFNTGKVKIIERDNLEKIINEQKFQASGLVDESQAANIGNIAGVEYVCYGTIKEIDNGYTINARVVDVETGEICSMSRTNIKKDSYLENAGSSSAGSTSNNKTTSIKKPTSNLWTCVTSRNEFDGYTTYTFLLKGPQDEWLFFGYDKNDIPSKSIVRAGVNWLYYGDSAGDYDFKTESKGTMSKYFSHATWSKDTGWKNGRERFDFCYNNGESARYFIQLFEENNYLTIRHKNNVRRFQTQGFWEAVESYGITKEEINEAIANEEF